MAIDMVNDGSKAFLTNSSSTWKIHEKFSLPLCLLLGASFSR